MKKKVFICIGILLVLAIAAAVVLLNPKGNVENPVANDENSTNNSAEISVKSLDFDAMYKLHQPEEIVLTVGDWEITWGEYFYVLYAQLKQMQDYFESMAQYGVDQSWDSPMDQSGTTFAQYALSSTENTFMQFQAVKDFAKQNNIVLNDEAKKQLEDKLKSDITTVCGEDGTEEEFEEHLSSIYMSREMYDEVNEVNVYYQQNFIQSYGENGEKITDQQAMDFLNDNEYMSANHILFMTIDQSTGESLDDEAKAEKKATAEKFAQELAAITDKDKLLQRFNEIKEEYCEDTGKEYYPNGYVFVPGTMVEVFENTCKELGDYQVSEPVESEYGYHIILKLPLEPDALVQYSQEGTELTGRKLAADNSYGLKLEEIMAVLEPVYAEGFEKPSVSQYVI